MISSEASNTGYKAPRATKWSGQGFRGASRRRWVVDDRKESARGRGGSSQSGREEARNVLGMYV